MINAAIITARSDSSRLNRKIMKNIGKKLLAIDILIKRAKKIKAPVILATSDKKSDDDLCNYVKKNIK